MYKLKRGVKIMETKKVLNLLTNQYFKSFKRFENVYHFMDNFNKQVKEFNSNFSKLINAVLNGDVNEIRVALYGAGSWFYIYATRNEKDKLDLELLGII